MTNFTFYLDWVICAQFAGICWAQAKGLYRAAGLDVALQPWAEDGRTMIERVMQGGLCAGSSEDNLIVKAHAQGYGVKAIGMMLQEPPLVLMTRADRGIGCIQDLRGKRVCMHADGIRILEIVLAMEGIAQSELQLAEHPFSLDYILKDEFDAVQGYAMTEPIELATLGVDLHLISVQHHRLKPYAQVFFAHQRCIEEHAAILRNFLCTSCEGWRQAMTHLDEAAHVIVGMSQTPADYTQQRHMLDALLPLAKGQIGLERFGQFNIGQWQRNLDAYAEFGMIPKPLVVADVVEPLIAL